MGVIRSIDGVVRRDPYAGSAAHLYELAVARAREPVFYAELGVPDTADGRFEMIGIHVHLLCRRLISEGKAGGGLAQALFDRMFADIDRNLREMGVGDLAVGKRIKRMAQDYFGRAGAVESGLQEADDTLGAALRRNLYAEAAIDDAQVTIMARYVQDSAAFLIEVPFDAVTGAETPDALYGILPEVA
jgi:cytochrome b pre-mRNA-processing protein 3